MAGRVPAIPITAWCQSSGLPGMRPGNDGEKRQ